MPTLDAESVDAIVCDPPYGLSFMGKNWDHGIPGVAFWREALRVAKPGAHLVAFGGTRTFHRLACAIEDAGWEIRDTLMWLYGSGFPKSLDVSKALDKQRDDRPDIANVVRFLEAARQAAGVTRGQVEEHFGTVNIGQAFFTLTPGSKPRTPMWDQWLQLKALLGFGDEMDAEVWRLNGRKGKPGEAWDQREVIGLSDAGLHRGKIADFSPENPDDHLAPITAPATDAAKQWAGWGTALKPAWEPIILARKPLAGTVAQTVARYGTGAINVDACRIGTSKDVPASPRGPQDRIFGKYGSQDGTETGHNPNVGRWPANVVLSHSPECNGTCDASCPVRLLDEQSGERKDTPHCRGKAGAAKFSGKYNNGELYANAADQFGGYGDTGGASRFYYTAKASRREREAGLEGMPQGKSGTWGGDEDDLSAGKKLVLPRANGHPTVKPLALMRWLCRLVTPPGGLILDPFTGSGSTGCAAVLEGFRFTGIEQSEEYCEIARRRIAHWAKVAADTPPELEVA
jgi:hypothetical protein